MERKHYPRPQFVRADWMNLNGKWDFEFDDARIGLRERWQEGERPFALEINVPFCYESKLSGIASQERHDVVWYRRTFRLADAFAGRHTLLHFGAVDYRATVWVNGRKVAEHEGGHTPFSADITNELIDGDNLLVVRAEDDSRDISLLRGKQYWKDKSESIFYTRTTGIWQTVWLEPVSGTRLDRVLLTPDIVTNTVELRAFASGLETAEGQVELKATARFDGQTVAEQTFRIGKSIETYTLSLNDFNYHDSPWRRWWTPEHPNLYDLTLSLTVDGVETDRAESYFGMRKISVDNGKLCLNHRPYFMKLVLDQGYFPEGLLTAPTDEALKRDVEYTKAMGFNGARKHQKLEDPLYLYWCDKLGLLVWGEAANAYEMNETYIRRFTAEWQESIARDYNHPCIVAWVPLNESWGVPNILDDAKERHHALAMYHLVKSLDRTRLVVSNDGWEQMRTDLLTIHDYEWQESVLEQRYSDTATAVASCPAGRCLLVGDTVYEDQPILVSEFGGIAFKMSDWEGWGYSGAENADDFLAKLEAVVRPLLHSPVVQGFCYTQLTDVEQEINGLLTYDRRPKADLDKIKAMMSGQFGKGS